MQVLSKGSKGEAVKVVQLLLRSVLVPPRKIKVDGDFGPGTESAVKAFQRQRHLKVDGTVSVDVLTALGQSLIHQAVAAIGGPPKSANWMDIAITELGVSENALPGEHNKRIVEYHSTTTLKATTDETPWCSSFVNWVMVQSGRRGTSNALAKSWASWGSGATNPSYGAVIVIKKKIGKTDKATGSSTGYHVGFFISKTATAVRILGGNQSDKVKYSNFMLAGYDVIAYRTP